jgi:hypothetical protein
MIKPSFWDYFKVGKLSFEARLLFIAMWNFADDEGFLEDNADWLRIKVFPFDKNVKVDDKINEISRQLFIFRKNGIIKIKNFLVHQKIKSPSQSKLGQIYGNNGEMVENHFGSVSPLKEVKVKEEKRKEVNAKVVDNSVDNFSEVENQNGETANSNGSLGASPPTPPLQKLPDLTAHDTANGGTATAEKTADPPSEPEAEENEENNGVLSGKVAVEFAVSCGMQRDKAKAFSAWADANRCGIRKHIWRIIAKHSDEELQADKRNIAIIYRQEKFKSKQFNGPKHIGAP